ncbi:MULTISPECIES: WXG100 family type VII secretion target [unclassified Nocardiopsis]|uniref:WXG100 family type VII secretion target n=1 Tax=unclassified Nocardiopsis TaxID=2649073 RepID=UPI0013578F0E|nr:MULTISPECIES: WXG100 family type VII secretion target [unclassified Nocardiopsis]
MNGFDVSYGYVDDATVQLRTQTDAVARQIEELDSKMQTIIANEALVGEMATNYNTKVSAWRKNVEDMRLLLAKAELALNEIRNNYAGTDRREAMNWAALL